VGTASGPVSQPGAGSNSSDGDGGGGREPLMKRLRTGSRDGLPGLPTSQGGLQPQATLAQAGPRKVLSLRALAERQFQE
jgi:hypothetical protein